MTDEDVSSPRRPAHPRPPARRGIVVAAVIAVAVTLLQWETRPQTDDATVRANFVGIAPQVSGHIVELRVRDNQPVQKGDLLFLIDPRPYEIALERARAALALTRKEVDGLRNGAATAAAAYREPPPSATPPRPTSHGGRLDPVVADAEIARLEAQRRAAEAALKRAQAEFQHADDHLKRLEPLLPAQFVTADRVEEARTQAVSAAMGVEQARTSVQAALAALDEARARKRAAVATLASTRAQHVASEAALQQARDRAGPGGRRRRAGRGHQRPGGGGRSRRARGRAGSELLSCARAVHGQGRQPQHLDRRLCPGGAEVFTLVDTPPGTSSRTSARPSSGTFRPARPWTSICSRSPAGTSAAPSSVSAGPCCPRTATSVMGLPRVERSLDWIRLAARFPVRIKVEDPGRLVPGGRLRRRDGSRHAQARGAVSASPRSSPSCAASSPRRPDGAAPRSV